jgi:hypothetical protein
LENSRSHKAEVEEQNNQLLRELGVRIKREEWFRQALLENEDQIRTVLGTIQQLKRVFESI